MSERETYKIAELQIKNFKCIESTTFKFDNKNLVVFDGPNGYGKTTAFDAIETIFSQTPRKVRNVNINAGYAYKNSPIHKVDSEEIVLSLILENDSNRINIKRVFEPANNGSSMSNNIRQIYNRSRLFINEEEQKDGDLDKILDFPNIRNLFNVLSYVEQDENTFFIKNDPKERYRGLTTILGIEKEKKQLDKLVLFERRISELITRYENQKDQIEIENEKIFSKPNVSIEYLRLIDKKEFKWDVENVEVPSFQVRDSFFKELIRIQYVIEHKESIKSAIFLSNIIRYNNDRFLEELIKYYWSFENIDILEEENQIRQSYQKRLARNKVLLEDIRVLKYENLLSDSSIDIIVQVKGLKDNIDKFKASISLILTLKENLSVQAQVLESLKERRRELNDLSNEHLSLINLEDSECPTCGFDWGSSDKLIESIASTEEKIFKEFNENNAKLEKTKEYIRKNYLERIRLYLISEIALLNDSISKLVLEKQYQDIFEKKLLLESEIKKFFNLLNSEGRERVINLINKRVLNDREKIRTSIEVIIQENTPTINKEINVSELIETFEFYFNNNLDTVDKVTSESINQKKQYIEFRFYNSVNEKLLITIKKIKSYKNLFDKVKAIKNKFDRQIKQYTKVIIENIKIPFYIYTGKILQEHSLGTGLVFDLDINKRDPQINIRPINRDQEVSYTLSSGQLSATVISLMLVLNKVYNNSKLGTILIDDPLQTLDEINTHSLIEVLKHNFSNQQIILSTHEDRYSKFMRYKYEKFRLTHKNIKMKDFV